MSRRLRSIPESFAQTLCICHAASSSRSATNDLEFKLRKQMTSTIGYCSIIILLACILTAGESASQQKKPAPQILAQPDEISLKRADNGQDDGLSPLYGDESERLEISLETAVLNGAAMNGAVCPDPLTEGVCEGESIDITFTLTDPAAIPITVDIATGDATAIAGQDYTSVSMTLTFPAFQTSASATFSTIDDTINEPEEEFLVTLSNPSVGANIGVGTFRIKIFDDDPAPAISIADASANESAERVSFSVTLDASSDQAISVTAATGSGGTATAGTDYTAASEVLTFEAGQTSKTFVVVIADDGVVESSETFTVELSSPTADAPLGQSTATGTILDSAPPAEISIADASASEDALAMTFAVTLSAEATESITVEYATADGSATQALDYESTSGTLTFAAGVTSETISVTLIDDELVEGDETFSVQLSGPNGADLADASATATINENDGLPAVAFASGSATTVNECAGDVSFTVVLEPGSGDAVAVAYATSEGTASADEDYEHAAGTINFGVGETERTVIVPILADNTSEDAETFYIALSDPVNATLGSNNRLSVSIENAMCQIEISIADASASEGAGTMTFAVTLSAEATEIITVGYATADGSATQALDYGSTSGTLTFTPGETTQDHIGTHN